MVKFTVIALVLAVAFLASAALDRVIGASEQASTVGNCIGAILFAIIVSPAAIHDFLAWKRWKRDNDA